MLGYKVCRVINGKYYSATSLGQTPGNSKSPGMRHYLFTKAIKPWKGWGPLTLFDTLQDARNFGACTCGCCEIIKCKYEPSKKNYLRGWFIDRWIIKCELPTGTVFAESVMLLEIV